MIQAHYLFPLSALWFILGTLYTINLLYFSFRYQKKLDKQVMGDEYFDMGFIFNMLRLFEYGLYCLFPNLAKKKQVLHIFEHLEKKQKLHLIFHSISVIAIVIIGIILAISFKINES